MTDTPTNQRHVHALLEEARNDGLPKHILKCALEAVLETLMEGGVTDEAGAGYGDRSEFRAFRRTGYRERTFHTALGTSVL